MEQQQIKAFIDAMAASDLDEMEVSHDGWTLRLVRHARGSRPAADAAPAPAAPAAAAPQPARTAAPAPQRAEAGRAEAVPAPMFGVVHLQQAPGDAPFVRPGDIVAAGQMLCTIEAMKVFNEVRTERGGRVAAVHVTSGAEVEAGQPLVTLEQVDHV